MREGFTFFFGWMCLDFEYCEERDSLIARQASADKGDPAVWWL